VHPRRPPKLTKQQWSALREGLSWEREERPTSVQKWLDRFDPREAAKQPSSAAATTLVVALLVAAFAGIWIIYDRDLLPQILSTATSSPASIPAPQLGAPVARGADLSAHVAPIQQTPAPISISPPPAPVALGPSRIEMAADTIDVDVAQPAAQVTIRRKGSLRGEVSFTWWTESGTAKPAIDFTTVAPQLEHIRDGSSGVVLTIPLIPGSRAQAKSFYVVIGPPEDGAALGTRTLTMVTLPPTT
jgi:hypothetical protein